MTDFTLATKSRPGSVGRGGPATHTHPTSMPSFTRLILTGLAVFALANAGRSADSVAAHEIYSEPLPRTWSAPAYPPEAIQAGAQGRVTVAFVVDAEGRVIDPVVRENKQKPHNPLLKEAVLAAAKLWTFGPALDAGKPVPRAVFVTVGFYLKGRGGKPSVDLPRQPDVASTKPAKELTQADPAYPEELMVRKLPGAVEFEFQVTPEGKTAAAKVLYASDAAFVTAGLETLSRWTFEPARQGPLAVVSGKKSPMRFFVEGDSTKPEDILKANGITGPAPDEVDQAPEPGALHAPVYPRARAVAGERGDAEVKLTIGEDGNARFVDLVTASHPEFGAALVAAVGTWQFRPAAKGGNRVAVTVQVRHHFELKEATEDQRIAVALKTGIPTAKGLDRPLAPLWRIPPVYPAALLAEKPKGEAVIEFIIDRTGRARLPQAVSATHETFGWAAATAISQWVFEAPLRNGEAVDVRVSIPVSFSPPVD